MSAGAAAIGQGATARPMTETESIAQNAVDATQAHHDHVKAELGAAQAELEQLDRARAAVTARLQALNASSETYNMNREQPGIAGAGAGY